MADEREGDTRQVFSDEDEGSRARTFNTSEMNALEKETPELHKVYTDPNDIRFKELDAQRWREEALRLSNILNELEGRCKVLTTENQQLESMVHKYRTEYDVDTSYLKNQVNNERERQSQWKELYFKAHMELMELKRHNPLYQSNKEKNNNTNIEYIKTWNQKSRSHADSSCKECEVERKRKFSENESSSSRHSTLHTIFPPHVKRISASASSLVQKQHSPIEKREEESARSAGISMLHSPSDVSRATFTHILPPPSQVFQQDGPLTSPHGRHQLKQYFKCQTCGIYYDSEQKLHFHMELHSERYGPPGNAIPLSEGTNAASPTECFVCSECNQNFTSGDEYRRHLLLHVFKCKFCGQTLENEMSFLVHVKVHGEAITQPYFCFICDKQFVHVSHLTRHILSHPDEQSFECVECGKQFARKGHMTRHMAMHSKCRPYTCGDCGKTFAHRTHLRRHEIVHSGVRPHKCKVCQQSFSRKSSLSRHYFIHTTEKPFVCPVCDKGFNRKGRLKNHLKIHIREGYPELADYVIERRPITKEFIETINQVKTEEPHSEESINYTVVVSQQTDPSTSIQFEHFAENESATMATEPHAAINDDDITSSSDSDEAGIDEGAASEEIGFYEPNKTVEPNNNTVYRAPNVTVVQAPDYSELSQVFPENS